MFSGIFYYCCSMNGVLEHVPVQLKVVLRWALKPPLPTAALLSSLESHTSSLSECQQEQHQQIIRLAELRVKSKSSSRA